MSHEDDLQTALDLLRKVPSFEGHSTGAAIDDFIEEMEQPIIKVERDDSPSNPWTDWDCEVPILVAYLSHARMEMHEYGVEDRLPHLERPIVVAHWREMLAAMELRSDWQGLLAFAREEPFDELDRALAYALDEWYQGLPASDRLELLKDVYGWLGVPCVLGSTTGYSQGDYAEVLAVATPEWVKKVGAPADSLIRQCESAIKLYGWWAWGDVWGYTIETRGGEDIDSCWGFYGDELKGTGMLDNVEEKYRPLLEEAWEKRFDR